MDAQPLCLPPNLVDYLVSGRNIIAPLNWLSSCSIDPLRQVGPAPRKTFLIFTDLAHDRHSIQVF
jgi:hypothetical protein